MEHKYPPREIDHLRLSSTWKKTISELRSAYTDDRFANSIADLNSMVRDKRRGAVGRIGKALSRADAALYGAFRSQFGYGGLMVALSSSVHELSMIHPVIAASLGDLVAETFHDNVLAPIMEVYGAMARWKGEIEEYGEFVGEQIALRKPLVNGKIVAKKLRSIFSNAVFSGSWKIRDAKDIAEGMERRGELRVKKLIEKYLASDGVGNRVADVIYARSFDEHVSFVFG